MVDKPTSDCLNCNVEACPVNRYCSEEWQQFADQQKTLVPYKKNQLIFKGDTQAFGIYIIYTGKVMVYHERDDDKRQVIRLAREGDILEYIQDENKLKHPFSAEALEECTICYIPKDPLMQMFRGDTQLAYHLERDYAHRLIAVEKRLTNAMIMNSRAKVADALLVVSSAFDGRMPFIRKELSEMIGVSAEHIGREIRKLADEGVVELNGKNHEVVILDEGALKEIISQYE